MATNVRPEILESEGAQLYAVNSIPHTVLIDGNGTIIARGLHGEELQAKIAEGCKITDLKERLFQRP